MLKLRMSIILSRSLQSGSREDDTLIFHIEQEELNVVSPGCQRVKLYLKFDLLLMH